MHLQWKQWKYNFYKKKFSVKKDQFQMHINSAMSYIKQLSDILRNEIDTLKIKVVEAEKTIGI